MRSCQQGVRDARTHKHSIALIVYSSRGARESSYAVDFTRLLCLAVLPAGQSSTHQWHRAFKLGTERAQGRTEVEH